MQIKIFNIPILGGEQLNEEMNRFLRSKKILQVQNHVVNSEQGAFWCFCIKYLDEYSAGEKKEKVDYRELLDEPSFSRFSEMRKIRKQVAEEEAIPAYAVFTNEELAELAKIEGLTEARMKSVKGIGQKKVEKYGHHFLPKPLQDEKG
ncbi:MAG: HRDC domain-containing protein [Lewinellaceae bacterium]|nr:HRDC domain-containing protein [Lewinellaceae bacterium]